MNTTTSYDANFTMGEIESTFGLFLSVPIVDNLFNLIVFIILAASGLFFVGTEAVPGALHVAYSKFAHEDMREEAAVGIWRKIFSAQMSSRTGFFILYFCPLVSVAGLFAYYSIDNLEKLGRITTQEYSFYTLTLFIMWSANFFKRCIEVCYLHIYTGTIPIASTLLIAFGYSAFGIGGLIGSNQVPYYPAFGTDSPTFVKDIVCIAVFTIGILVNGYAHIRLRQIRTQNSGEKKYYSPAEIGCLFRVFICPHYIAEMLAFVAFGVFGATPFHYLWVATDVGYLTFRTRATYNWYVKKGLIGDSAVTAIASPSATQLVEDL